MLGLVRGNLRRPPGCGVPGLVAERPPVAGSIPHRFRIVTRGGCTAWMATYSSRDAIATATARAVEGILPLVREWGDASRELWATPYGEDTHGARHRLVAAYAALLAYGQRYGVDVHTLLGA